MNKFAAIDFETANRNPSSICSVGAVIVEDNKISDSCYHLIHPAPNYYNSLNTSVHGLTREDTNDAPLFPEVWAEIEPKIHCLPLIAHNKAFDENCLRHVFQVYDMDYPGYQFYCTYQGARKFFPKNTIENYQLQTVAAKFGYDLKRHHHALSDAEACAIIAMNIF